MIQYFARHTRKLTNQWEPVIFEQRSLVGFTMFFVLNQFSDLQSTLKVQCNTLVKYKNHFLVFSKTIDFLVIKYWKQPTAVFSGRVGCFRFFPRERSTVFEETGIPSSALLASCTRPLDWSPNNILNLPLVAVSTRNKKNFLSCSPPHDESRSCEFAHAPSVAGAYLSGRSGGLQGKGNISPLVFARVGGTGQKWAAEGKANFVPVISE